MNQFYRLLVFIVVWSIPLSAADPFTYPRADCVVTDPGHNGAHPLWRNTFSRDYPGDGANAYVQFGYTNLRTIDQTIALGNFNIFVQDPQFRNQPTLFHPGTHFHVFGTSYEPPIGLS